MITGIRNAIILSIEFNISFDRPAIITRLNITDEQGARTEEIIANIVRLSNPDSARIGLDELRSTFAAELHSADDQQLVEKLISDNATFVGRPVQIDVRAQVKNGIVQRNTRGEIYYNIHLRPSLQGMNAASVSALAHRLLSARRAAKATTDLERELGAAAQALMEDVQRVEEVGAAEPPH